MKLTEPYFNFSHRHIGIHKEDLGSMLQTIGVDSIDQLIAQTIPDSIRRKKPLQSPEAMSEQEYLDFLKGVASKNKVFKNYIGLGYSGTVTPSVILRNIFQNPGWYTQYTPYQAEIAQGRLEALLNFQTVVSDLTGLPIANASLLDEATAAAEAMAMFHSLSNKKGKKSKDEFFISDKVLPQTIDVCITRAEPLGITIVVGDWKTYSFKEETFGVLLQYPNVDGAVEDYSAYAESCKESDIYLTVAADLLSLALLIPPGEWGADCVVGNSQRFGVPMGYGGPHAAFFATKEDFKRLIPGRLIGVSVDSHNNFALRMALQTREQHIKREKATSNICTAQALLSIMAGMYAAYHGPDGIRAIARRTHELAKILDKNLHNLGVQQAN
ncbi:MAG: glycine dehydrogenase, partial [Saprospiraceae bacterium]